MYSENLVKIVAVASIVTLSQKILINKVEHSQTKYIPQTIQ